MKAILVKRPGNNPVDENEFETIEKFNQIETAVDETISQETNEILE